MLNEILVRSVSQISQEMLLDRPKEEVLRYAKMQIAEELSECVLDKKGVFETEETEAGGIRVIAECYVLTHDDFVELVGDIKKSLTHIGHTVPTIGGVYEK